jgi:hypothetical protein
MIICIPMCPKRHPFIPLNIMHESSSFIMNRRNIYGPKHEINHQPQCGKKIKIPDVEMALHN